MTGEKSLSFDTDPLRQYKYICELSYCRNGIGCKNITNYWQVAKVKYDSKYHKMNLDIVLVNGELNELLTTIKDIKTPNINQTIIKCNLKLMNFDGSAPEYVEDFSFTTMNYVYNFDYGSDDTAILHLELT